MKKSNYLRLFITICGLSLLAGGCLFKSSRVQARHFVLTPLAPPEQAQAAAQPRAIEVASVKMPSYLSGDSMVIRKSATEVHVLEESVWAEQLDEGFRRVLEDDLASLLSSGQSPPGASDPLSVAVKVQRFDVDTQGQGTLIASWQFTRGGSEKPVKSGLAHITRPGPSPIGNPQAIATTLSALLSQFSQQLASSAQAELTEPKP